MDIAHMSRILSNGVEIPIDEDYVWRAYNDSCILCGKIGVCIHHCPPKSLNPKWKERPFTWWVVCNSCHTQFHNMNWRKVETILRNEREKKIPDFQQRINNGRNN